MADRLGIDRWYAVVGGSMGGMRALEWAVGFPERVARAVVLAVGARATAEQVDTAAAQAAGTASGEYEAQVFVPLHQGVNFVQQLGQPLNFINDDQRLLGVEAFAKQLGIG